MEKNKNRYFLEPKLRLIDQKIKLEEDYPESYVYIKNGKLYWQGEIMTASYSESYRVIIEYKIGKYPIVKLFDNNLDENNIKNIPHKYTVDIENKIIELCLFKPNKREWLKNMYIADTIIPWTVEWIYFYETWKITGEWLGGGEHTTERDVRCRNIYKEINYTLGNKIGK